MIFSEIYGAYYRIVEKLLTLGKERAVTREDIRKVTEEYGFGESILRIEPALIEEKWKFIGKDGEVKMKNISDLPLTILQKRWLASVKRDKRVSLFLEEEIDCEGIEPLFTEEDFEIFDAYSDGDEYESEKYRENFRCILEAIREKSPLSISLENRRGERKHFLFLPRLLEYSEKDDKFRVLGFTRKAETTVNLSRIQSVKKYDKEVRFLGREKGKKREKTVRFELVDERNALERVLLHFAHLDKSVERLDGKRYLVSLSYEVEDEVEMVIRFLSFGPMIRVREPESFVELMRERLRWQRSCGL